MPVFIAAATVACAATVVARRRKNQKDVLRDIQENAGQFTRAKISYGLVRDMRETGREAEKNVLILWRDRSSWIPCRTIPNVSSRQSKVRAGNACMTSITVDQPLSSVSRKLKSLYDSGSLDPNCKMSWRREVDTSTTITGAIKLSCVEYADINDLIPSFESHVKIVLAGEVIEAESVDIDISDELWGRVSINYVITIKPTSSAAALDALANAINGGLKEKLLGSLMTIPGASSLVSKKTSVIFDSPRVAESSTQVRYNVFSEKLLGEALVHQRDFILAARATHGSLQTGHGLEEGFVLSMTSVKEENLNADDWNLHDDDGPHLLQLDSRMKHGHVHALGIVATAMERGSCDAAEGITKVEIFADLDPSTYFPNRFIDADVQRHVLKVAERLSAEFKKEEAEVPDSGCIPEMSEETF